MKHINDGITYGAPKKYKCKNCGERLTKEECEESECNAS